MNLKWFVRKGVLFLPVTFFGWVIALVAAAGCVYLFISIDSHSHSVSDTLMNFVFNAFLVAAVYYIVAYFTSGRSIK